MIYKKLFEKLKNDMFDDDIVIEIKILNTSIIHWNKLMSFLFKGYSIENHIKDKYFENITRDEFSLNEEDIINYIIIDFNFFNLNLSLFDIDIIDFFSNSIINLEYNQLESIFYFCEEISKILELDVDVYCEGYSTPSLKYIYNNLEWNKEVISDL